MELQNNNNIAEQLMPIDSAILNNNELVEQLMPIDCRKAGPMNLQNNNNIAEQLMPIDSMKVGPMKVQNNNNIAEQLIQIKNNREEIQMGHCFKLPCIAILITQITWKVWNSTH